MQICKVIILLGTMLELTESWQLPRHNYRANSSLAMNRTGRNSIQEPAGVESLFYRAHLMRHNFTLRGIWQSFLRIIRMGKRRRKEEPIIDATETDQALKSISLPKWACVDAAEEKNLAKMKLILSDELEQLYNEEVVLANGERSRLVDAFPDVYSDFRLLRFLRKDEVQDPATAASRFKNFISSRKENNHDEIRIRVENSLFRPPPELEVVDRYLPCQFREEPAENGTVPLLLHVSRWDTSSIARAISENKLSMTAFLQYWTYMFDSLHLHLYRESMKNKQMIFIDEICDLNKLSLAQFSPSFVSKVMKPWVRLTQANYPETAKRIVFINPPKVLSIAWKIVTPLLSPGTVAKISFESRK
eukprot:scaffold11977_cov107-Cylindrotheca_fusiformis.AAC.5